MRIVYIVLATLVFGLAGWVAVSEKRRQESLKIAEWAASMLALASSIGESLMNLNKIANSKGPFLPTV